MEARLVKQDRYTPAQVRDLGVREIGRIGSILFIETEGPLILMYVGMMAERVLDRYGIERAKERLECGQPLGAVASAMGVSSDHIRACLAIDGWQAPSRQAGGPRVGANIRLKAKRKRRAKTGFQSSTESATLPV